MGDMRAPLQTEQRDHDEVEPQRDAQRVGTLKRVSAAAGDSWDDVKRTVDSILADARATAGVAVDRFRGALVG
jgi:hypothetical protein